MHRLVRPNPSFPQHSEHCIWKTSTKNKSVLLGFIDGNKLTLFLSLQICSAISSIMIWLHVEQIRIETATHWKQSDEQSHVPLRHIDRGSHLEDQLAWSPRTRQGRLLAKGQLGQTFLSQILMAPSEKGRELKRGKGIPHRVLWTERDEAHFPCGRPRWEVPLLSTLPQFIIWCVYIKLLVVSAIRVWGGLQQCQERSRGSRRGLGERLQGAEHCVCLLQSFILNRQLLVPVGIFSSSPLLVCCYTEGKAPNSFAVCNISLLSKLGFSL